LREINGSPLQHSFLTSVQSSLTTSSTTTPSHSFDVPSVPSHSKSVRNLETNVMEIVAIEVFEREKDILRCKGERMRVFVYCASEITFFLYI
jgi:hypothetical protein